MFVDVLLGLLFLVAASSSSFAMLEFDADDISSDLFDVFLLDLLFTGSAAFLSLRNVVKLASNASFSFNKPLYAVTTSKIIKIV